MTCIFPQCIINTPIKDARGTMETLHGIRQVQMQPPLGGEHADLCVELTGNTVIFDSFSTKEEVDSRNMNVNSVSKKNDSSKHFSTEFSVKVSGKVTTVLHPQSVERYVTVDKQNQRVISATNRQQKKIPTTNSNAPSSVPTQDDTTATNRSSSDESGFSPPSSPTQVSATQQPQENTRKRSLEQIPAVHVQPPQPRLIVPMHRAFAPGFMHHPFRMAQGPTTMAQGPTTAASIMVSSRPRVFIPPPSVILEKPTFTRADMRPLFALSDDEDEELPPPPKKPATMPASVSPPDHNMRPPASPSPRPVASPSIFSAMLMRENSRLSSDEFINIPGRTPRNSSTDTSACVVSVRDMLNMDLPGLSSRMSSQDEPVIRMGAPRSRVPSRDTVIIATGHKMRVPSQDEIDAARVLSSMNRKTTTS